MILDRLFTSVTVSQIHQGMEDGMVGNILSENAI